MTIIIEIRSSIPIVMINEAGTLGLFVVLACIAADQLGRPKTAAQAIAANQRRTNQRR